MDIKRIREARDILHRLEDRGTLENNLSAEQITAIRIAEFALDELCEPKGLQPVKRGKWRKKFLSDTICCSECKVTWSSSFKDMLNGFNYCPNCGARMDGAKNE